MALKRRPADKAFADAIKGAYNHVCQVCNKQGRVELSHIHSRRHRTIRWAVDNCLPKCHSCHRWWHENPTESGAWFRNKYGEAFTELLREKRDSMVKVRKAEEKEIAAHYRAELNRILALRAEGVTGNIEVISWQ